jgi:hypothetical protein
MHILGISTAARSPEEDRAIVAWNEEMRAAALAHAKKNRIPNVMYTFAELHPGTLNSRENQYEKLAVLMSTVDAVLIVSSVRPLIDFTKLTHWVDVYRANRTLSYEGILVEFVFVGEANPNRLYHLRPALAHFARAKMERVLSTYVWVKRNGELAHKMLARTVVEQLHGAEVLKAA